MTALHNAIVWADPARAAAFSAWLCSITSLSGAQQLNPQSLRPASADASFRRYFRIDAALPVAGGQSAPASYIIMDAPPDKEDCTSFAKVAGLMARACLQAPRVLAWEEAAKLLAADARGKRDARLEDVKRKLKRLP